MKKTIKITTVLFLILVLCLSFAACGGQPAGKTDDVAAQPDETVAEQTEAIEGAAVGDTFNRGGYTIELADITEGADSAFGDVGEPEGKWVTLTFTFGDGEGDISIDSEGFYIAGKPAETAVGKFLSDGLAMLILFDVDANTGLDQLALTVE